IGYNLLTRAPLRWRRVPASSVSSTVAMSFSFTVNGALVFHPESGASVSQGIRFLAVTCFSSYALQSAVIHVLSHLWRAPVVLGRTVAYRVRVIQGLGDDCIERNLVKAAAVAVGLLWNFLGYRYFVFV
ncbi:MAG: GtrA family protein, partial [Sulfuricaulis sp.]|nr:GtrA family protein [Sulfuricaulis sp.]